MKLKMVVYVAILLENNFHFCIFLLNCKILGIQVS